MLWRSSMRGVGAYDPSMEPIRSGRRTYVPLDDLHYENLCSVLKRFELTGILNLDQTRRLSRAWERLDPWEDVVAGLGRLRSGTLIAPCSNGSIGLMVRLARHAGFSWDCILGAEIAKTYKPEPDVYLASCDALRLPPGRVMMVAAHNHDLEAAAAVGLQTGFFPSSDRARSRADHGPLPHRGLDSRRLRRCRPGDSAWVMRSA